MKTDIIIIIKIILEVTMRVIEINNLTKNYGHFQALKGINLSVNQGEIFGFIGPNGAGKSTTIRILLGMLKATSGQAKIFNLDVFDEALPVHEKLAYVPAEVNLWPNLTGGEVIDILMSMTKVQDKDKRDRLLKLFDLDPTKKCRTYSKGNKQKVALVAALSSDAELYIFDEPTSGLDPLMEKVFQDCVHELKNQGKTVFLSSHILSEVEKLCDHIAIIKEGEIVESGSLSELRHLMRTKLTIQTKQMIPDLDKLSGVHNFTSDESIFNFDVDNEKLDSVIAYISKYGITKIESNPPTLEDLFLRYYVKHEAVNYEK